MSGHYPFKDIVRKKKTPLEIAKEVLDQYAEGNDYTSPLSATLAAEVIRLSEENASFRECPNEGDCVAGLMPSYRDQAKEAIRLGMEYSVEIALYREVLEKQTRAVEKLRPHLENMEPWYDPVVTDVEAKVASLLLRYNDAARSALEGEPSE